jgi:hypothetical protein
VRRKRWSELSGRQQAAIVVAVVIQQLLAAATLLDLRRRPSIEIRGSKRLWAAAAFVNFIGPHTYFAIGRRPASDRGPDRRSRSSKAG